MCINCKQLTSRVHRVRHTPAGEVPLFRVVELSYFLIKSSDPTSTGEFKKTVPDVEVLHLHKNSIKILIQLNLYMGGLCVPAFADTVAPLIQVWLY